MKDVVPAMLFIGELVRVTTTMERAMPSDPFQDGDEELEQEPDMVSLVLLGVILDSDETYLTLGTVDDEGMPHPKAALKHKDIKLIEIYEEDDGLIEGASQIDDHNIN
jgi:hypothetical protein